MLPREAVFRETPLRLPGECRPRCDLPGDLNRFALGPSLRSG